MSFTCSLVDHVTYVYQKGREKGKPRIQPYSIIANSYIALTLCEAGSLDKEKIDKRFVLMYRNQARNSAVVSPMR